MPKKDSEIEKLGEVLEKSLKRLDLSASLEEYGVWPIWDETVGSTIARNAQPEKIRHGTLFVKVSSSMWMQQLQYMKELISDKLNQKLGKDVVKNIFFIVGKLDSHPPDPEPDNLPKGRTPPPQPKPGEEDFHSVNDPEIRQALKRLFSAHSRRREKNKGTRGRS